MTVLLVHSSKNKLFVDLLTNVETNFFNREVLGKVGSKRSMYDT